MTSVCRRPSVGSKRWWESSVRSVSSVRERTTQRVTCVSSLREGVFYFSQKNTDEQNTQTFTETLSQPITQNLTANTHHPTPFFSWNALWPLYAEGVLWAQTVRQKLRELCALCERKISPRLSSVFFFLTEEHRRTERTNFHRDIKSTDITERYS